LGKGKNADNRTCKAVPYDWLGHGVYFWENNFKRASVRGVFFEGKDIYKNAGFKEKNHIQIAIKNPNCIKGYFIPRELDKRYPKS